MSLPDPPPRLTAVPDGGDHDRPDGIAAAAGTDLAELRHRSWPTSHLTATVMTALMAVAVSLPTLLHNRHSTLLTVLALPAVLATLGARLVFEALDSNSTGRSSRLHLPAALAGSLIATLIMMLSSMILGLAVSVSDSAAALALGTPVLSGAGLLRDLEIRVRLSLRRVFLIGSAASLRELRRELASSREANLVGAVVPYPPPSSDALIATVERSRATVLVLDGAAAAAPSIVAAADVLSGRGVRVRDLLGYYEAAFQKIPLTELTAGWFLFERERRERTGLSDVGRRASMAFLAGVLLLTSLPLMAVLALAIRVTSPGPAIFRQQRVGKNGTQFTLFKLRTMRTHDSVRGDEPDTAVWATDLAHRITPLGRILRRYRLDELPQLWNVLRGDLALVGPRPEQVPIVERLSREIPHYEARHTVRPGLTGWAQVNLGYAGSLDGARAKLQRDLYYVKHRSLGLDLLILWLTVKAVFSDPS